MKLYYDKKMNQTEGDDTALIVTMDENGCLLKAECFVEVFGKEIDCTAALEKSSAKMRQVYSDYDAANDNARDLMDIA